MGIKYNVSENNPLYSRRKGFSHIRTRLIVYFCLLFFFILATLGIMSIRGVPFTPYIGAQGQLRAEAFAALSLIADLKKERLLRWLEERGDDIHVVAENKLLASAVMQLRELIDKFDHVNLKLWDVVHNKNSYKMLVSHLDDVRISYGVYNRIQIADAKTGMVLVSTDEADLGSNVSTHDNFTGALQSDDAYLSDIELDPQGHKPVLYFSHAIKSKNGEILAVTLMEINPNDIIKPMLHTGEGLGKRGEALLVNNKVSILTALKHPLADGSIAKPLVYRIKAEPAVRAARGEEGIIEAKDYRGEPVLAAYRYIPVAPEWGWGMVVKRDKQELFAPLQQNIIYSILIGLIGIFIFVSITLVLTKKLTNPIHSLSLTASKVTEGDFNARVPVTTTDEVGVLASTFNSMIERIQNWHRDLEKEVEARTTELTTINEKLKKEVAERKRTEEALKLHETHLQTLLELNKMADCSEKEILDFVLEEGLTVTQSQIAFIGLMNENESVLKIHAWSKKVMGECSVSNNPIHFPIANAGLWGEAVRQRKPIIVNDYIAQTNKKGCPEGHVAMKRFMSVPVFDGKHIVAVACVANKEKEYQEANVRAYTSMLNDMWRLIQHKQAADALRKAHQDLEVRVEERTAQLKATHAQLLHVEKLSAMGKLSASFAHEFNNPIFGIKMVLEQFTGRADLNKEENKSLLLAIKECSRMSRMIENLQDFYRPSSGIFTPVNINGLIEDMLQICGKKLKLSRVKVVKDFAEDMPKIPLVADQLKQVILNLITNAEEAMAYSGGCLTIQTKVEGNKAHIIFKDNGSGIDKETTGKIFDLFFTTKGAVKGSGLGLSVSYGIIKGHGGDILVESIPNKGSTFTIELPINAASV